MKKFILVAAAALTLTAPAVVPAIASANSTTAKVVRQYNTQIRNRAQLGGYHFIGTSVKCASNGGGYYTCYATYEVSQRGLTAKYGQYLNVTPTRWYSVGGNARMLWIH